MMILITEYKDNGRDAITGVRRIQSFTGLEHVVNPNVQFSLWPTPKGTIYLADAQAIKVSKAS